MSRYILRASAKGGQAQYKIRGKPVQWFAQAPSNIALIKYMGKKDPESNLPDNPSLSYTLNNLISSVVLEQSVDTKDRWEPLVTETLPVFDLSTAAILRFLRHLARLKTHFNYSGTFVVRSNNNFPHSSGLASSASSFAALTKCAALALSELTGTPLPSIETQARLSRQGSGSSCRSFFPTWALWDNNTINAVELPYQQLIHQVIIISRAEKAVSSSEAHQRVRSSTAYEARGARARDNLRQLLNAFETQDWAAAYKICWEEFQDMHDLFHTSEQPFSYMNDTTQDVLARLTQLWREEGDGPLVTMDAGPNIHLLYRMDQADRADAFQKTYLMGHYDVL